MSPSPAQRLFLQSLIPAVSLNKKKISFLACARSPLSPPQPLPELAKTQGRGDGTATGSAQGSKPLQAHTHTEISSSLLSQARFIYPALLPTADFPWEIHGFPSALPQEGFPFPQGEQPHKQGSREQGSTGGRGAAQRCSDSPQLSPASCGLRRGMESRVLAPAWP